MPATLALVIVVLVLVAALVALAVAGTLLLVKKDARLHHTFAEVDDLLASLPPEALPSWLMMPDVEQARFVSLLATSLWSGLKAAHEPQLRKALDKALEEARVAAGAVGTTLLDSIEVAELSLGSLAPQVVGVKAYAPNASAYVLDVQLRWDGDKGNAKLKIEAMTAGIHFPITVAAEHLVVQATLRVELGPFLPRPPYVEAVRLSFLQLPLVDIDFKALGFNLTNLPGLTSLLSHVLKKEVHKALLFPRSVRFPLAQGEEGGNGQERKRTEESVAPAQRRGGSDNTAFPPRVDATAPSGPPATMSSALNVRAQLKTGADLRAYEASTKKREGRNAGARAGGGDASDGEEAKESKKDGPRLLQLKILGLHGILLRPSIQAGVVGGTEDGSFCKRSGSMDSRSEEGAPRPRRLFRVRQHQPHTGVEAFVVSTKALQELQRELSGAAIAEKAVAQSQQPQRHKIRRPPGGSTLPDSYSASPAPGFPLTAKKEEGLKSSVLQKLDEGLKTAERVTERLATVASGITGTASSASHFDADAAEAERRLRVIRSWCSRQKRGGAGAGEQSWTHCYWPAASHPVPGRDPAINETLVLPSVFPSHDDVVVLELLQYDPVFASSRHCVGLALLPLSDLKAQTTIRAPAASASTSTRLSGEILQPTTEPHASPRGGDFEAEAPSQHQHHHRHQVLLSAHKGSGVLAAAQRQPHEGIFFDLAVVGGTGNVALEASLVEEEEEAMAANAAPPLLPFPRHLPLPVASVFGNPEELSLLRAAIATTTTTTPDLEERRAPPQAGHALAPSDGSSSLGTSSMVKSQSSGSIVASSTGAVDSSATTGPSPLFSLPSQAQQKAEGRDTGTGFFLLSPDQGPQMASAAALADDFERIQQGYSALPPGEITGEEDGEEEVHERVPLLVEEGEKAALPPVFRGDNASDLLSSPWQPWSSPPATIFQQGDQPRAVSALSSFSSASSRSSPLSSRAFNNGLFARIALSSAGRGLVQKGVGFSLAPALALRMTLEQRQEQLQAHRLRLSRVPPPEIHVQPSQSGSVTPKEEEDRRPKPGAVKPLLLRAARASSASGQPSQPLQPPHPSEPSQSASVPHPAAGTGLLRVSARQDTAAEPLPQPYQTAAEPPLPVSRPSQTPLPAEVDEKWSQRADVVRTMQSKQPKSPSPLTQRVFSLVQQDTSRAQLVQTPLPMGSPSLAAYGGGTNTGHGRSGPHHLSGSFSGSTTSDSAADQDERNDSVLRSLNGSNVTRITSLTRFTRVSSDVRDRDASNSNAAVRREEEKEKKSSSRGISPYLASPATRAKAFAGSERKNETLELTPAGRDFRVVASSPPPQLPPPQRSTPTASAPIHALRSEKPSLSRMNREAQRSVTVTGRR